MILKTLISYGDNILIGASGGCDSTFLIYMLNALKEKFKLNLSLCHFNHCLRDDSDKDAEFVKELAERFGFRFYLETWKEPIHSQKMARRARYDFFLRCAKEIRADKIALGHNLDDNVETILFHIIRGEGPHPIPEKREINGITIIRPLIKMERRKIEEYLEKNNIPFITDKTNLVPSYTRNKIRLKLIPLLEGINPRFKNALLRLSLIWQRNLDFLESEVKKGTSHPAVLAYRLRKKGLSFSEIERAIREYKKDFYYRLPIPSSLSIDNIKIEASIISPPFSLKTPKNIALFDYDKIKPPLFIRNIKEGDKFIPFGSNYQKKIARFFIDEKIPKEKRREIPILFDQEGVLWVMGERRSNRAIITEKTKDVLLVSLNWQ